ncbi:ATP-binding protein [Pseudonocardia sp. GCM10023141]|uniref:ATP-binding protein n=1 Tax=Pseudonocardia sp. GCM10023141 TaxID=3252653 RepID=UPI0036068101
MKVETTRTAVAVRLQHSAAFHSSVGHLHQQLIPLVRSGLERGGPVAVALSPDTEAALLAELGQPAGLIVLARPHGPDAGSGQTVAALRARELRELTAAAGPATVISEHWNALDGADGGFWTEFDAALNIALADLAIDLTCFFPEMPLHQAILDGARRNHPHLLLDGRLHHNPDHRPPREVLAELPAAAPMLLGAPELQVTFGAWQLGEVRTAVESVLLASDYGAARAEDVVLAVNEIATNAVEHGAGEARMFVWAGADGFVCEVHDTGILRDPLPGLQAPHPSDPRGRGVWIARQLCDSLHVWTDGRGTHVRMYAAR